MRDAKRQQLLEKKRRIAAPVVVAVLPLSADVDVSRFFHGLRHACEHGGSSINGDDADVETDILMSAGPLHPTTVHVAARPRVRLTILPPPSDRSDPLAVADLGRCAELLLLLLHGGESPAGGSGVDAAGQSAMAVMRAMGMPPVVCCVVGAAGSGSGAAAAAVAASMKERSAAKKRAEKALATHVAGEHRILHADTAADMAAVVRHLVEHPPAAPPLWRQQRPGIMVERAEYEPLPEESAAGPGPSAEFTASPGAGPGGTLVVYGYVRGAGLSANQLVTVPGGGDYRILSIHAPRDPNALGAGRPLHVAAKPMEAETEAEATAAGMEMDQGAASGDVGPGRLIAQPDPEEADQLVRENVPEPGAEEQTWPTDEEMAAATAPRTRRRKVPEGTSEYQAAWILDGEDYGDEEEEEEEGEEEDFGDDPYGMDADGASTSGGRAAGRQRGDSGGGMQMDLEEGDEVAPELQTIPDDDDDAGTDAGDTAMLMDEEGNGEEGGGYVAALEAVKQARRARRGNLGSEQELAQLEFPDEVDVPLNTMASVRFQKYRGLKSLRTSAWDPKESLPAEYARVFAFENFKRAHKRAREAQQRTTQDLDPCGVSSGSYVAIRIGGVSPSAAARVTSHVDAAAAGSVVPLTVFGLLQHEAKLSVVNFALRKATGYTAPVANKEELLFVTGLRSFTARPVLSTDDPGLDKHRTEKFLHAGQQAMASVYAPIMYPPLPLLAFKLAPPGKVAQLAALGRLSSCDPDRINLKRIILTGIPSRVHRRRATVRFMFHNPDDVRWFKPVELFTKYGRRGRITEPLGTHGAMKCLFDSPLQQRDTVCMALYKRAFPVWPKDMGFAER
ncbi:hypothetical protein VaNZ11_012370 [Volvox africanus]|uniref:Bms1-type G domain-containing protein n=1 Tax=Volvox africanus TaxID=51714 RepID=A0ABQ5SFB8_9CHLO|nr:hypothetical protein VaNZ11_012370 [Volvox africanus]